MSGTTTSPPNVLSLLAEFDDLNRCNNILNDGAAEEYFLQFLSVVQQWQQQQAAGAEELARVHRELQLLVKENSALQAKLTHARQLLDTEKKRRLQAESSAAALEKQMNLARELLFSNNRTAELNNETLEKLAFLNQNNNNSTSGRGSFQPWPESANNRLNTIDEINSTGNLLSDQSFSRSEDDLNESAVNGRRSWRRHRPSAPPATPPKDEEHPPSKKRRSTHHNKESSKKVIATTTVTVDCCTNNCADKGRIVASSVLEGFGSAGTDTGTTTDEEMPSAKTATSSAAAAAPTPTASVKEYNVRVQQDNKGHYSTNIQNFSTPLTPAPRTEEKKEGVWCKTPMRTPSTLSANSPRTTPRLRQHTFSSKTILRSEHCTYCGMRIKFAKSAVKCSDCRAVCHVECRHSLPLPCIPSKLTPSANGAMGKISDYTPNISPMVPALIIHCVNEVEARGLTEIGLYRVPGSEKEVKALKDRFMRGRGTPPLTSIDINVICGCIKDFLRSIREPLITFSLWADFVSASEASDPSDSEAALYQAISELPQPNRDTLAFMMLHLQRVAECVECKMPIENLAKVFGPTIVGYSDKDPHPNDLYKETLQQFVVMERLLKISSDYWARFAGESHTDGSSIMATPPLPRTPSTLRPRLHTAPHPLLRSTATPSSTTTTSNSDSNAKRGFFYTPVGHNTAPRRKFFGSTSNFDK